eukprot:4161419-Amphidinium_carterae.1
MEQWLSVLRTLRRSLASAKRERPERSPHPLCCWLHTHRTPAHGPAEEGVPDPRPMISVKQENSVTASLQAPAPQCQLVLLGS